MIVAKNIHKHYGNLHVLKGVSVHIKESEIVSVVGKSGAGKTTFLQILGTLDSSHEDRKAELFINKKKVIGLSDKEMSRFRNENIGFIFQFHQLLPEFSALENVCIPGFIAKRKRSEVEKRAKELLSFLNLSHRINHKPAELSGGEQQRVAVARALINNPAIILADEPSGNLDSHHADELHQLFFKLRDEFGQTFVIVTHNKELAEMTDRKLVMQDGEIISGN